MSTSKIQKHNVKKSLQFLKKPLWILNVIAEYFIEKNGMNL